VNEEQIQRLLARAEEMAEEPRFRPVTLAGIRQRVRRRHLVRVGIPTAAAAMVLVGVTLWAICAWTTGSPELPQQRIASLEDQVKQLQAQTEATLKLVQEVLERDRQDRRLASLQAELARIPDPRKEIEREVDEAAFVLVYQADKLYKELNQTDSAVQAYKDVIQLFPTNQWADVARERLSQIEQRRFNKSDTQKGATAWEPRNT
jgi:vacuolar-type H+-ATPase subunit I/STV1